MPMATLTAIAAYTCGARGSTTWSKSPQKLANDFCNQGVAGSRSMLRIVPPCPAMVWESYSGAAAEKLR